MNYPYLSYGTPYSVEGPVDVASAVSKRVDGQMGAYVLAYYTMLNVVDGSVLKSSGTSWPVRSRHFFMI